MLYTIASDQWTADRPLTPAQARLGLYRTRDEAGKIAGDKPTLAVAVRYDATRGTVVATAPASFRLAGGAWSAPAFLNDAGGIISLVPIPQALVKRVGPARLHLHREQASAVPPPAGATRGAGAAGPDRAVAGRIAPRG